MSDSASSTQASNASSSARKPRGMCVVLCGVDGCGKSTVGALLQERLKSYYGPGLIEHYHWKPPVFSKARRAARGPITEPHAQKMRNPLASLAFFAVHWSEFFLGSIGPVRQIKRMGGLVLIDRFYYDFFVDQRRYRLSVPQFIVRIGYALLPKPELAILLDAPVEVLHRRKQEVSVEETARQRAAFQELFKRLPNGLVVDASQPPEKVVEDIMTGLAPFLGKGEVSAPATRTA